MALVSVFEPPAAGDDGVARGTGGGFPPAYSAHDASTVTTIQTSKSLEGASYVVRNGLLRFNTSSLTNAVTVSSARLEGVTTVKDDTNARGFVADYFPWTGISTDYTASEPTAGLAINTTLTQYNPPHVTYWTLDFASTGIERTGNTGLRTHITGGSPTGQNSLTINSSSASLILRPRLLVTHTYGSPPSSPGTYAHRFQISAGTNDIEVSRYDQPSWPPAAGTAVYPDDTGLWITKGLSSDGFSNETSNVLLSWDTSGLPDNAVINSANLRFWNYYMVNTNNRNIVGEYFDWTGTTADFTQNVGSTAANTLLSTLAPMSSIGIGRAWATIPLTSVSGINKTGLTKMRLGIGGTATPTGENIFRFYSYEETTGGTPGTPPAELEVTYTVPGTSTSTFLGGVTN